ncbi:MAG: DUF308 domain-containing protein [Muribaculaceae bacterium]|nr:DUF308 domain-containing protein [Muribaculaceae bacterium]
MKGKLTLVITNIIMLALGAVLIVFFDDDRMAELIAVALGVLFLAPSIYSLIMLLFTNVPVEDAMHNPRYNLIPTIGGLSFGLLIVVKASLFVALLKYIFAILLLAGGLYYVFYLLFTRGRVSMPKWYFFLPSLVAIAGVVALVLPIESNPTLFLMTGVSLIALSVTSVVISYSEYVAYRAELKAAKANAEVVSVEVAEVGDNASEQ